jgi:uncharacterized phage-like protein YoqJ
MKIDYSVAFTGHQSYDGQSTQVLCAMLRKLCMTGYDTFLSGMACGFDLAAAEAVLALRQEYPILKLIAVVPFVGQEKKFSETDRARYRTILQAAHQIVTLADSYTKGAYYRRNDYLVEHAGKVVAWYIRRQSGTGYTIRRAQKRGIEVINLADPTLF